MSRVDYVSILPLSCQRRCARAEQLQPAHAADNDPAHSCTTRCGARRRQPMAGDVHGRFNPLLASKSVRCPAQSARDVVGLLFCALPNPSGRRCRGTAEISSGTGRDRIRIMVNNWVQHLGIFKAYPDTGSRSDSRRGMHVIGAHDQKKYIMRPRLP